MSGDSYTIANAEAELLREIVGKDVKALEAVIVARDDMAWGTVRMHVGEASIDIVTSLKDLLINDEGDTEEFGVLTVSKAAHGDLSVEDVDKAPSWCDIDALVSGVMLVNSHVMAIEDSKAIMERSYTQAIVFELANNECLVLDKGAWFSEMISIGMGHSWEDLTYDDSQDWEDDPEEPEIHFQWQRSIERL